jgi:AcrR family transcriptional regulator
MARTSPLRASRKVEKLSRAERNEETRRRLFDAATKVVGKFGYAEASVARITELAGVAQGTFYNHFENRQELLDQLLPTIGIDMVHFIRERAGPEMPAAEREMAGFRAFFEFVHQVPEFQRILNEAEFFAPAGYQKHLDNVATAFVRILKRARASDEIVDYSDEEFEAIVHMFMGARGYLSRRYASGDDTTSVPNDVITAYEKLVTRGLFKPATQKKKS